MLFVRYSFLHLLKLDLTDRKATNYPVHSWQTIQTWSLSILTLLKVVYASTM